MESHPLTNLLAIVGPTASGKSSFSMNLARQAKELGHAIEIISMDSALIYRGMDIGTAKPSVEDQQTVPHHGINILEPWESYSAAMFAKDVSRWVEEIRGRGAQPVIVGGTMLYWRALIQGLSQLPASTPEIRNLIEARAAQIGWPAMHEALHAVDPITADRLPVGDTQRIGRALEVFEMTGVPMSELISQSPYSESRDDGKFPHLLVSFEPNDRAWLHERISQRFKIMLESGFLKEVESLMQLPQMHPELPSMRSVGYRQALEYFANEISFEQFVQAGTAATRQLGKRQLTWLRAMPSRYLVNAESIQAINQATKDCLDYLFPNQSI
ncbi:tRNA (adenosine(37)-N6)-dimethylallyltransferase MiaA [Polynucleobacter kasalickyi]|uniref:tRNA dimethylallyltransferase n=1 Tax=Polynucleobacter kasalickyi TaxID=1938817 RepID=A0A1W1YHG0_9BURK|nr:tRNA (adenosine(37)-N6)-dimethylallyltransferase MiaA [Polynucleobacter kasalickyi]SMC35670.1 tRNA dimethylallyltransferase [Polynucleobacter kasalickyi]